MSVGPTNARPAGAAPSRPHARESLLRRVDWVLLAAVASLCLAGAVLVWSATRSTFASSFLKKDFLNVVVGAALGCATALIDYRTLRAYAPFVYVASCLGLLAVLSPLGATINGSHSWIPIGAGFELQPSEFAKVALVVGMAMILGEKRDTDPTPRDTDVLLVLSLAAVPLGLILLQPDLGTVMVFVFVIFGVLAISGAPTRWLMGLLMLGLVAALSIARLHVLKPYQVQRFTAFTHPASGQGSYGYNTTQARITIGSGGVFGKGLFHGPQTNGHFVPEQQTDFVFTVAGEELGFVGAGTLIGLTGIVLWRGLRIAGKAEDPFGTLVATGVVCWFAFQAFENVGMCLGIMPVTGLPLPFVSYGGSSMFANLIAIGLLENVHIRSRERPGAATTAPTRPLVSALR